MGKNKKSMELPINLVVTLIIGIVIFGLGMGLFSRFSGAGDETIDDLTDRIKNDIASLECDGTDWICSPAYDIGDGEQKDFTIYFSNKDDVTKEFKVEIINKDPDNNLDGSKGIWKDACGGVVIIYPINTLISLESGYSGSIPFRVITNRIKKSPCSFVTTARLLSPTGREISKTSLIINVE